MNYLNSRIDRFHIVASNRFDPIRNSSKIHEKTTMQSKEKVFFSSSILLWNWKDSIYNLIETIHHQNHRFRGCTAENRALSDSRFNWCYRKLKIVWSTKIDNLSMNENHYHPERCFFIKFHSTHFLCVIHRSNTAFRTIYRLHIIPVIPSRSIPLRKEPNGQWIAFLWIRLHKLLLKFVPGSSLVRRLMQYKSLLLIMALITMHHPLDKIWIEFQFKVNLNGSTLHSA